ncbi:aldehyde oxidase-like protein-like [Dorcoceras hygrometricum]|uniref:Aldehyde oxidase-like protein-like n=1 Tax=Dorcoceras hygrometricum TaxID=472368 RepID=A0A2Z7DH99_9LAMI|nr:aldehyde oxidase-like protein-like [Dorcoceras hygrometricum]
MHDYADLASHSVIVNPFTGDGLRCPIMLIRKKNRNITNLPRLTLLHSQIYLFDFSLASAVADSGLEKHF